ncbi:hypothetical protein N5079_10575 [Planotetraspora sp. A-T 1434]|uniref:hypothetical protein n=1 Tax=Planotetraspora sp. A-T 1434 TaxID=2979219 RepID=UPI0021C16261|nr:hypothetical protein [Planotetraspora sp. A-T 1434]MCT9930660.1 hypothetical protein [Planotetraspora sp. A-T 1434]
MRTTEQETRTTTTRRAPAAPGRPPARAPRGRVPGTATAPARAKETVAPDASVRLRSRGGSVRQALRRPPRAPFVLLVVGLMSGGLVTLLLLNTVLAQDSFKVSDLRSSTDQLREQAADLEGRLRVWDQPNAVEEAARRYGLREDRSSPQFIDPGQSSTAATAASAGEPQEEGTDR